jgi:hypothetical protein
VTEDKITEMKTGLSFTISVNPKLSENSNSKCDEDDKFEKI